MKRPVVGVIANAHRVENRSAAQIVGERNLRAVAEVAGALPLILASTVPYWGFAGWDDMDRDPAELRARFLAELGEDYTPSIEQLARFQEAGRAVRSVPGGRCARVPWAAS